MSHCTCAIERPLRAVDLTPRGSRRDGSEDAGDITLAIKTELTSRLYYDEV